jgi:hypothetical protein
MGPPSAGSARRHERSFTMIKKIGGMCPTSTGNCAALSNGRVFDGLNRVLINLSLGDWDHRNRPLFRRGIATAWPVCHATADREFIESRKSASPCD